MVSSTQWSRSDRLVIGISGRIGSGKTSVGMYLSSRHGFQYLRYSQILSEWKASDTEVKGHLQEVGWKVMSGGLQTELNRQLITQIKPARDVAVDGLRHPIDCETLKNTFTSAFHLMYIDSPAEARYDRLRSRGRYASFQAFATADSHPVEQQIETLRQRADFVIQDEGSLEDLYRIVDERIGYLRKEGHT